MRRKRSGGSSRGAEFHGEGDQYRHGAVASGSEFPVEIKPQGVEATSKNGLLEITLPKVEVVEKVKIDLKTP
jgi:HSP20 family molecular chaperone IbpA